MSEILIIPRGPLMVGIAGVELDAQDLQRLSHPLIGGVILFKRNFVSKEQLKELVKAIKGIRVPELVVAVDHEGGRVQRFKEGFTKLPPMALLGQLAEKKGLKKASLLTKQVGFVLASELRSCGVDLSFAPVLDLNWGNSSIIGDRSFGFSGKILVTLAKHLVMGMSLGGMSSCGKHFPGHGFVREDSHNTLPIDYRKLRIIEKNDIIPFRELINHGMEAVMPAHVTYEKISNYPAGFSKKWLKQYLRKKMNFKGTIFSDDLNMAGAAFAGNIVERVKIAQNAGCDILLVCNNSKAVDNLLKHSDKIAISNKLIFKWHIVVGKGTPDVFERMLLEKSFKNIQKKVENLTSLSQLEVKDYPPVGENS